MVRLPRFGRFWILVLVVTVATWAVSDHFALGQSSKSKSKASKPLSVGDAKQMDARLEKLQETFSNESTAIIDGYERAGYYEKAKFLLEVMSKLDPKNDSLKKRITDMEERILERTEIDQKFNTASDWTMIGTVEKDRPSRVEATGDFKMTMPAVSINADGFSSEDPARDLIHKIPTGALMGVIVTEANQKEKKFPEPFAIKSKHDFTPKHDGDLYIKINAPPGAKCIGDLKLKLNGIGRGTQ